MPPPESKDVFAKINGKMYTCFDCYNSQFTFLGGENLHSPELCRALIRNKATDVVVSIKKVQAVIFINTNPFLRAFLLCLSLRICRISCIFVSQHTPWARELDAKY